MAPLKGIIAMKMKLILANLLLLLLFAQHIAATPQDLGAGLMLAAAQAKELIESGAAARDEKSIELFGQKMRGGFEFGFGDAMRPVGKRRRRNALKFYAGR